MHIPGTSSAHQTPICAAGADAALTAAALTDADAAVAVSWTRRWPHPPSAVPRETRPM